MLEKKCLQIQGILIFTEQNRTEEKSMLPGRWKWKISSVKESYVAILLIWTVWENAAC